MRPSFRFHLAAACLLGAASFTTAAAEPSLVPLAGAGPMPAAPWHVVGLPQQTKPFTRFALVDIDGKKALKVEADESYGNLVHPLEGAPATMQLAWQWRIEKPLEGTDLHERRGDDTEIKVCVFFDEPLDNVPFAERQLLRVARSRTTEPLPTATVCYVWDAHLPAGTAIDSPFTRRLRYIVLQSGSDRLDRWVSERRDVAADYKRVFGAESPSVPPVVGIAVGADADNTHGHSVAYVSELRFLP